MGGEAGAGVSDEGSQAPTRTTPTKASRARGLLMQAAVKCPGSAQDAAGAVVDEPAVETGDAEFDVVAHARQPHAVLDQVPHGALMAVGHLGRRPAIAAGDRIVVLVVRQIAVLVDAVDVPDEQILV